MTTRMTLFLATLVQESALSVSGIDGENTSDHPFAMIDGKPILSGRGLKGAAVSMARRFFDPLPLSISGNHDEGENFRRSAWEFEHARPLGSVIPVLRAGVGIVQKTGARAQGILFDREVIPAGATWRFEARVNWRYVEPAAPPLEEGILEYVLAKHWAESRCWLGGGVARGLGWCRLDNLQVIRLDEKSYQNYIQDRASWTETHRKKGQKKTGNRNSIPIEPTRSWFFRVLDVNIHFGEYKPSPTEAAWGVDMFAIGPHDLDRKRQALGKGKWSKTSEDAETPESFETNRALLLEEGVPLLPGSSIRGPLRHSFSRMKRAAGEKINDPHGVEGDVGEEDAAGKVFGTVKQSGRLLIRDARAEGDWYAANLHSHAEDEFSAGAYGTSLRTAVRLLRASFPVRMVVEGSNVQEVDEIVANINEVIALGVCGHLPIGADKTRGAGWGIWEPKPWKNNDILGKLSEIKLARADSTISGETLESEKVPAKNRKQAKSSGHDRAQAQKSDAFLVRTRNDLSVKDRLTLGEAFHFARQAFGVDPVAFWCEPTLDFKVTTGPMTFGWGPPKHAALDVDEVMFYGSNQCWHAAKTRQGWKSVHLREVDEGTTDSFSVEVHVVPAHLHVDTTRFGHANLEKARRNVVVREWHVDEGRLGYAIMPVENKENS